jgi:hypothetical protein
VVAHVYNSSYLGDKDWEDCGSMTAWAKSSQDHLSTNKLGMVVCDRHTGERRGEERLLRYEHYMAYMP